MNKTTSKYRNALEHFENSSGTQVFSKLRARSESFKVNSSMRQFDSYWIEIQKQYNREGKAPSNSQNSQKCRGIETFKGKDLMNLMDEEKELDVSIQELLDEINSMNDYPRGLPIPIIEKRSLKNIFDFKEIEYPLNLPQAAKDKIQESLERDIEKLYINAKNKLESYKLFPNISNCLYIYNDVDQEIERFPKLFELGAKFIYEEQYFITITNRKKANISELLENISPIWKDARKVQSVVVWLRAGDRQSRQLDALINSFLTVKNKLLNSVNESVKLISEMLKSDMEHLETIQAVASNTFSLLNDVREKTLKDYEMKNERDSQNIIKPIESSLKKQDPLLKAKKDADIARKKSQKKSQIDFEKVNNKIAGKAERAIQKNKTPRYSRKSFS